MSEEEINWSAPPVERVNWKERLEPLLSQPGRWAYWDYQKLNQARMAATMINHRRLAIPSGEWKAKSRKTQLAGQSEPGGRLYVQYVGPLSEAC